MNLSVINVLTFAAVAYVVDASGARLAGPQPACFTCTGCQATTVNDPNANPPITAGVQILVQASGVTISSYSLTTGNGSCSVTTKPDGTLVCGGDRNCEFTASYSLSYTGGTFHNNNAPCEWSRTVGSNQALASSISWIQACDNANSWQTADCYVSPAPPAGNCWSGTVIMELKFFGHCGGCAW